MTERYIKILKVNNTTGRLVTNVPELMESVVNRFSVYIDKYWFHPKVKLGMWDGKINFVNKNGTFPIGLFKYIYNFVKNDDIKPLVDRTLFRKYDISDFVEITEEWLKEEWIPRTHQLIGAQKALESRKCILEHATSSGKSLTMAMIIMFCLAKEESEKVLVLVPNLGLIEQLRSDFISYGIPEEWIGRYSGKVKDVDPPIIISTWQSMHTQKRLCAEFDMIVSDECLHPDTLITMADNTKKPISQIKIGDMVKTLNEITLQIENKPIKKIHHNISTPKDNMFEIELENGQTIKITGNHKVKLTDGSWKKVEDLDGTEDIEIYE